MPIVDVQIVVAAGDALAGHPPGLSQSLADALGKIFKSSAGRTWVRLQTLPAELYAENATIVEGGGLPVFVTILHAHRPAGAALETEVLEVTGEVARCTSRDRRRVHVQYAPDAAGRQAFGGTLVK